MRKLCVFNRKGGVGKSTIVSILVSSFLEIRKDIKVLCIDLDGQKNAGMYMGIESKLGDGLGEVYTGKIDAEDSIHMINDRLGYVHINDERRFTKDLSSEYKPGRAFNKLMELYTNIKDSEYEDKPLFDFIIFDLPPGRSVINICALEYADDVFIPIELTQPSIKGVIDVSVLLRNEVEDDELDKVKLIIPNKLQLNTNSAKENFKDLIDMINGYFPQFKNRIAEPIPQRESVKNFTECKNPIPAEIKKIANQAIEKYMEVLEDVGK